MFAIACARRRRLEQLARRSTVPARVYELRSRERSYASFCARVSQIACDIGAGDILESGDISEGDDASLAGAYRSVMRTRLPAPLKRYLAEGYHRLDRDSRIPWAGRLRRSAP